jgi:hypothetical protein
MTDLSDTQLVLQLQRIDELFNAPDADPFSSRAIDVLGEAGFEVVWKRMVRRWPRRPDLRRVIMQLPSDQITPALTESTRTAWQRYCAAKIEANQQQRRFTIRKAQRLLGYSALILLFALALMFVFYVGPLEFLPGWLRGILTILAAYAASLAIWDSLNSLLFDWAPFVRDNTTYTLISGLDIRFEPQPGADSALKRSYND